MLLSRGVETELLPTCQRWAGHNARPINFVLEFAVD